MYYESEKDLALMGKLLPLVSATRFSYRSLKAPYAIGKDDKHIAKLSGGLSAKNSEAMQFDFNSYFDDEHIQEVRILALMTWGMPRG